MDGARLRSIMRKTAEYFGLAGQPIAEEVGTRADVLEARVEALERRAAQTSEDVETLRAELIRLRGKL